jgi:hypothetical protein
MPGSMADILFKHVLVEALVGAEISSYGCSLFDYFATLFQMGRYYNIGLVSHAVGRVVPRLLRLVADLSLRKSEFNPRRVHMGFVVDKVALGQVRLLVFPRVNITPVMLYILSLTCRRHCTIILS